MNNRPEFYTVREFAELLKMAEKTVRANIKAGAIKAVKIGKSHRIPVEEVDRLKREAMGGVKLEPDEVIDCPEPFTAGGVRFIPPTEKEGEQ